MRKFEARWVRGLYERMIVLLIYPKSEKDDLSDRETALFDELLQSLAEAKAIARGEAPASRRIRVTTPDAKAVREQIGLSQSAFAQLLQVSVKTLQNWEQHRRNPTGPAAALLKIVAAAPDVALKTLRG